MDGSLELMNANIYSSTVKQMMNIILYLPFHDPVDKRVHVFCVEGMF